MIRASNIIKHLTGLRTNLSLVLVFSVGCLLPEHYCLALDVGVWDNGTSSFTDAFVNADAIDNGNTGAVSRTTNIVTDSQGRAYVGFRQNIGGVQRLFLSRYDGTDVGIWDNATSSFTDNFAAGDPIDNGTANNVVENSLAMGVDSEDRVYLAFAQSDGAGNRLYLTRYDGSDVKIWDNNTSTFTDTFTNADPIDNGTAYSVADAQYDRLDMEVDSAGTVYISFIQSQGVRNALYLSRYNGTDVAIWDNGTSQFTDTFTNADPIDLAIGGAVTGVNSVLDRADNLYLEFVQSDGTHSHVYFVRFDGSYVGIWDGDEEIFTDNFSAGTSIDNQTAYDVLEGGLWDPVADSHGRVYFVFARDSGNGPQPYLARFDGEDVKIWNNSSSTFIDVLVNGDAIGPNIPPMVRPSIYNLTIDGLDRVYIPMIYWNGPQDSRLFLSRFDGSDVGIWQSDLQAFTDFFPGGDPIDRTSGPVVGAVSAAVDSSDNLYLLFTQDDGTGDFRLYLTRHTGTSVGIWDNDSNDFTSIWLDGDAIDNGVSSSISTIYRNNHVAISRHTGELFYAFEKEDSVAEISPYFGRLVGLALQPNIEVSGNNTPIFSGDLTVSDENGTDFGEVHVGSNTEHTYVVSNVGETSLNLGGTPIVSLSGSAMFTVITQPSSQISASDGSAFTIRFEPDSEGLHSTTVSINTNDPNDGIFTFTIRGTGIDVTDTDGDGIFNTVDPDDDNDGVDDDQELLDGTNSLDSGSFALIIPTTFCSEWNGNLGMLNINEYSNRAVTDRSLAVWLFDLLGAAHGFAELPVLAESQSDLLVHQIDGFSSDSYGRTCTTVQNGFPGDIDGRTVFYRPNASGFDFVFAVPFTRGQSASQFVPFNTFHPSFLTNNLVVNWISVTNDDTASQTGTLHIYGQDGSILRTEELTLEGGMRRDIAAHDVGQNLVGLVEWRPDSLTALSTLRNVRYYYDNSSGAPSFNSALQLEGSHGTGETTVIPLDARNGSSVLELSSANDSTLFVTVVIRSSGGSIEGTHLVELSPHSTVHVIADEILSTELGSASVQSQDGRVTAFGFHYSRNQMAELTSAYALSGREAIGNVLYGSYNNFLNQSCDLLLTNTGAESVTSSVQLIRYDATNVGSVEVVTPPFATNATNVCAIDVADTYGSVTVTPSSPGNIVGTIIRRGDSDSYQLATELR